jgi:formiminoglutamase
MSDTSSSGAAWSSRLEPPRILETVFTRPDDPRLGERIMPWRGDLSLLQPGRAVLVGFPQDEGVRRNGGRTGAALAPQEIRRWLGRLGPWDPVSGNDLAALPPLDAGNVHTSGLTLEESQEALGEVVAGILGSGAVPVVLGGGHETAYGHYLGYARANLPSGVINLDAHLDVRPTLEGRGNSGTAFRQMMEHPEHPLPGKRYACLGVQPHAVSRAHVDYARGQECVIHFADDCRTGLAERFRVEASRLARGKGRVYLSVDADVLDVSVMPGVSAPNVAGLGTGAVAEVMRLAGSTPAVASVDLVEVNPTHDANGHSARTAALLVWHFLVGLAGRPA